MLLTSLVPPVLGLALAFAACEDAGAPAPERGALERFVFSIGGVGVGGDRLELRGDTVVFQRTPWAAAIESVRTVPSPEAWRAFKTATEQAGVRRWLAQYDAENIADGIFWTLRLVDGGLVVESSGANAYPDRLGAEHEGSMPDDFLDFLTALGTLVGRPLLFGR
jgi:hypothetical protein